MTVAAGAASRREGSPATSARSRAAHEAWALWCLPRARRFRRALRDPEAAQARILERILRRNAASAYGRLHRFAGLRSVEEYRRRVPVVDYDDLAPWIERTRRGEEGVLTGEPVRRLVPSSGSTSPRKLVPWTRGVAGEWSRALQPWTHDLLTRHPAVKAGPAYWSVSPALGEEGSDEATSAVPVGFDEDSAYLGGLLGPLVRSTLAIPEEIRHVSGSGTFQYLTALGLLRAAALRL
ncbi:MAG TPA: GH3 auxin-responsive promoter family protein, partial [Longimicrobiales bacterium]|nr:GH3 auxin-responsive promoter family protein [Longimicrobiales bacterium]